ncbi:hypothetical protein DH2020_012235 [Rehmannia glutinosa]|uniref:Uncharacterized protein n=1 Tax=Rehmannia glutinosa TaxID=99300 RepID=A0ABR0X193_REHGL
MKFGKELAAQMVQEWQGAYMDYNHLKKLLKDIMRFRQQSVTTLPGPGARKGFLKKKLTMYRAFSGPTGPTNNIRSSPRKNENEVVLVSPIQQSGSESFYKKMFLRPSEEGGELEVLFFRKLDDELNKVVIFYEAKVEEVKLRAEELNKQMDALTALRLKVDKPCVEQKVGPANQGYISNEGTCGDEHMRAEKEKIDDEDFKPDIVEILDHLKINVDPDTPVSTLRNVIMSSKSVPSFSEDELRKADKKLRKAFVQFYQQLRFLKSYCFLNVFAFSKIMKKYDKITSRNASKSYMDVVEKSYLGSSDEVNKLIQGVEATFIKQFTNGNRRKGMKFLRPREKKERHGLFTGCSIALVGGIIVSIHARKLLNHEGREQYMTNIFPLYSLFVYIFLHMLMYGANTYFWRRFRVNYPFIFGFKPGTEMGFREIFLLASGLSVLAFSAVLSNLDMEMDPNTQSFQTLTELVPLGLVIVAFSDFFLADQLTSQVQAIRSLQFYICYYGWGDFKRRSNRCLESSIYEKFYIIVAIIPFWARVLQCLRRLIEEKNTKQGLNSLKYFSTVVALVMRTIYDLRRQMFWRIMAASTSGITTIYNMYWDIVIDWGLLRKNAKNRWLRDNLLISNKAVYFVAIVSIISPSCFMLR